MSRSKWKGSFISPQLFSKKFKNNSIKIWSRQSSIFSSFLNKSVDIYNGHTFKSLKIKTQHLGFKFGEYSYTRKKKGDLKKKNKKK